LVGLICQGIGVEEEDLAVDLLGDGCWMEWNEDMYLLTEKLDIVTVRTSRATLEMPTSTRR
jgi:hypothetical protein